MKFPDLAHETYVFEMFQTPIYEPYIENNKKQERIISYENWIKRKIRIYDQWCDLNARLK